MLGSLIIYLKGMRRMMFQLSGLYYTESVKEFGADPPPHQDLYQNRDGVLGA